MTNNDTMSAFLSHVCGIMIYFLAIFMNDVLVWNSLYGDNISLIEQGNITFVRLFGYIVTSIILLMIIRFYSPKKLIITSIILYCLSILFIIILPKSILNSACLIVYYATMMLISILLLAYILLDKRISNYYSIFIYSLSILLAYVIFKIVEYSFPMVKSYLVELEFISLNIILLGGFIYYFIRMLPCQEQLVQNDYRFFPVIKNMEVEMMVNSSIN